MSTQMTVRLSDLASQHVDAQVSAGTFGSRAAYLTWLVEREAARERAWQEVLRMRRDGVPLEDPDVEAMVKATSSRPLDLD